MRIKRRALNRSYGGDAVLVVFLLLFGLVMVLPLVYAVSSALKPPDEFWIFPPRFFAQNPNLRNFKSLFNLMSASWVPFSRYVINTVFISVVGTVGHIVIASLCAYVLAKHEFPGSKIIFQVIVLALMFNTTVTAVPNFLIFSRLGWIDSYWVLIVPAFASPLGLYLMKQFMEQMVPNSLLEAARIDGAREGLIFWRIVIPIVKPAWLTLGIFSFFSLWGIGGTNLVQSEELKTLNYALAQIVTSTGFARAGVSAAASVLMMIVPIIVFIFSQSNIVETMSTSGMKE